MKKSVVLFMALVLVLLITGCSQNNQEANAEEVTQEEANAEEVTQEVVADEAEEKASQFPFDLVTYNDMTVTFTHVPERIISANANAGQQLMEMGLGDKIVGTYYNNAAISEQYKEEFDSKPVLAEKAPALEIVLEKNPDFIYGRSSAFSEKNIGTHDDLSELGIMTLSSIEGYAVGPTMDVVYQDFINLGRIFDKEERANEIIDGMKAQIAEVEAKLEGVEPVTVFLYDSGTDSAYTCGDNLATEIMRLAGGINPFGELEKTWNKVNWEDVVQTEPDYIVICNYGSTPLQEKIDFLKSNPALADLKAVKEEKFVPVTLIEVFASARCSETVEYFAKAFHPEAFE